MCPHLHCIFDNVPPELGLLDARVVDLNFETYQLPKEQRDIIGRAFVANGVAVPGTRYKLRNTRGLTAAIELSTGKEPALPTDWQRYVISIGDTNKLIWLGKLVRQEQRKGWDLTGMVETEDGWQPK